MGRLPHFLDDRAAPSYVLLICSPWPTPPSALASLVSHSYLPSFALSLPAFPSLLAIFTWISSPFTIALLSRASLLLSFASLLLSFISLLLSFISLPLSFTSLSLSLTSWTLLPSSPPLKGPIIPLLHLAAPIAAYPCPAGPLITLPCLMSLFIAPPLLMDLTAHCLLVMAYLVMPLRMVSTPPLVLIHPCLPIHRPLDQCLLYPMNHLACNLHLLGGESSQWWN